MKNMSNKVKRMELVRKTSVPYIDLDYQPL